MFSLLSQFLTVETAFPAILLSLKTQGLHLTIGQAFCVLSMRVSYGSSVSRCARCVLLTIFTSGAAMVCFIVCKASVWRMAPCYLHLSLRFAYASTGVYREPHHAHSVNSEWRQCLGQMTLQRQ